MRKHIVLCESESCAFEGFSRSLSVKAVNSVVRYDEQLCGVRAECGFYIFTERAKGVFLDYDIVFARVYDISAVSLFLRVNTCLKQFGEKFGIA